MPVFPQVGRLGLGVGLDLPWGDGPGFSTLRPSGTMLDPSTARFFARHATRFGYFFFSFQPRSLDVPVLADYQTAYDELFAAAPAPVAALHHTQLNLAAAAVDRRAVLAFTNDLVARYSLRW